MESRARIEGMSGDCVNFCLGEEVVVAAGGEPGRPAGPVSDGGGLAQRRL